VTNYLILSSDCYKLVSLVLVFFFYLYGDFLFAMRRNLRQIAVNVHTRKIRKRRGETVRFSIETSLGTVDSG